ncbi:hypothetical protein [Actinomadura montaniterrae]|uniref:Uncharacterized protein n=1 Tax=Actinomadura montaniterrae TaxID=1803903 RepID=A0A6L3W0P6_9ACTN|nr:hypothetical protein [Actinomadura montaniterrae]KAB2388437.1 hypothetical protein F9B16_03945 [Actinomadura montaniterrae]
MNRTTTGLTLCALSAAFNADGVIALGESDAPPAFVGILSAVLGLGTLAGVLLALRGRRGGVPLAIGTRLASAAVLDVPTYFIGAPAWVYVTVGAGMVLGLSGAGALWSARGARAAA